MSTDDISPATQQILNNAEYHRALTLLQETEAELMATGSATARARLHDAIAELEKATEQVDKTNHDYLNHYAPFNLASITSHTDTSGTTGRSDSTNLVRSAFIFGHPAQQAVAKTAFQSPPDSTTIVTTVTSDPSMTRKQILRAAGVLPDSENGN